MKVVATLSNDGWVSSSKKILDNLLSNYVLTDASQSYLFEDRLVSLPRTYHENINNPEGMVTGVRNDLEGLLNKYFPIVNIDVELKNVPQTNEVTILIRAVCVDDNNVRTELSKISVIGESKLRKVMNLNNYAEGVNYMKS